MRAMHRRIPLVVALALGIAAGAAESAAPAAADPRVRTVVLGLQARRGVEDKALAAALSDLVQTAYARDPARVVIGRDEIARVLAWEADRQAAGCDDSGCLAEIGAALDAARIVTGSLDRIGSGYLVVLTEVDAKTAEPLGRAQAQSPADEDALVAVVVKLAEGLVAETRGRGAAPQGGGFAEAGSIDVVSDPRGAEVHLAGALMGTTPLKLDNLRTGDQPVRLVRADYDTVDVLVPVHPGGTTKVSVEMRIHRTLAEQNFAMRKERRDAEQGWKTARMWTGFGVGATGLLLSTAGGALNTATNGWLAVSPLAIGACAVGTAGLGFVTWGAIEALTPLPQPVPEWETPRRVVVTPPAGKGDVVVRELVLPPATSTTAY